MTTILFVMDTVTAMLEQNMSDRKGTKHASNSLSQPVVQRSAPEPATLLQKQLYKLSMQ